MGTEKTHPEEHSLVRLQSPGRSLQNPSLPRRTRVVNTAWEKTVVDFRPRTPKIFKTFRRFIV
jgi:hypothetical protein